MGTSLGPGSVLAPSHPLKIPLFPRHNGFGQYGIVCFQALNEECRRCESDGMPSETLAEEAQSAHYIYVLYV